MKVYLYFKNRKYIVPALIALFAILYGAAIMSYHHHEDGKIKDECPICKLQQYGNNALAVDYEIAVEPLYSVIKPIFIPNEVPSIKIIFSNTYPHAPPYFS